MNKANTLISETTMSPHGGDRELEAMADEFAIARHERDNNSSTSETTIPQTFQVENIKCGGCANTVKNKLKDDFGDVEINLEKTPREITLDIEDKDIDKLKQKMKSLGYPFSSETLGTLDTIGTKAKSFVSCAIGSL